MSTVQSIRTRELLVGGHASIGHVYCKHVTVDGPILTSADGTIFMTDLDVCREGARFDGQNIQLPGQLIGHWAIGSLVSVRHSRGFDGIYELAAYDVVNHTPTVTLSSSPRYAFSSAPAWAAYSVDSHTAVVARVAVSHLYSNEGHLYYGTMVMDNSAVAYRCLTLDRHHLHTATVDLSSAVDRVLTHDLSIITTPGDVFVLPSVAGTIFKIYNGNETLVNVRCTVTNATIIALIGKSHTALTSVGNGEWINI